MEIPDEIVEGITKIANKLTREHNVWGIVEEWQTKKVMQAQLLLHERLMKRAIKQPKS